MNDTTHGRLGYEESNNGRVSILEFVVSYELMTVNSYFKKKKKGHLVTFSIDNTKTQVDFLIRVENRRMCKHYKVISSGYLKIQHSLLVMDVEIKSLKQKKIMVGDSRVRWWNLTNGT